MSLRSVLFKSEDILSQLFCIESREVTFKDLLVKMSLTEKGVHPTVELNGMQAEIGFCRDGHSKAVGEMRGKLIWEPI